MNRFRKNALWIAGTLAVVLAATGLALRAAGARQEIERWNEYQRNRKAAGEDLGVGAWQPPNVAGEDNLMDHPWMRDFLASESSEAANAVAALQPWPELGLDGYDPPAEAQSWFDGKEAEAIKVRETARLFATHLNGIHEAAKRQSCRLPVDSARFYEAFNGSWVRLGKLPKVLVVQADAAISQGDGEAACEHLVALFRLGKHLRSQNFMLASVLGASFEGQAAGATELGLDRGIFSPEMRGRLLASMRPRPLAEELVAAMKVERAEFLQQLELLPSSPVRGIRRFSPQNLFNPPERIKAANALFFCGTLDSALNQTPSRETWERFDTSLQEITKKDSAPSLAAGALFGLRGIIRSLFFLEDDLERLRTKLRVQGE
ncbi:MAG TPA: hypothetical protein VIM57_03995 [Luteolibacter sp.]